MNEPESDAWECPSCKQDVNPEEDYICGTCDMPASHHLRSTTLCRQLHDARTQIAVLTVDIERLRKLLTAAELQNAKQDGKRPETNMTTQP